MQGDADHFNCKLSERDKCQTMNYRFDRIVQEYCEALQNVVHVALVNMNQPLKPEIIYLDKYGKLNPDWMIDRVYQIYRNERMASSGLKEPMRLDEFIKYANTINS